jgi:ATP-binding cassette subfamily B multidrug efflux pump
MRVIRYLKEHKGVMALIIGLLIVQAACELSLPSYTANIVDVGIQQSGIQHASPDEMRQSTFDAVCMLLPSDDEATVRASYHQDDDGNYVLNASGIDRGTLDGIMEYPMVTVAYASQMADVNLDQVVVAYQSGAVTKDQVLQISQQATDQLDSMGSSIVEQQAIAAVKTEYDAVGYDMNSLQMNYLMNLGLQMLGLAALGAAASACVAFLASRTAAKVGRNLRGRLFRKVVGFSDDEIQSFSAASLITRGTNDIQQIQMVCVILLRLVLYAPILAIGGIFMILRTDAQMGWIIVVAVLLVVVVVGVLMVVAMPKFRRMQKLIDRVNLVSREVLTGLPVIRAFNRQEYEETRFDGASRDLMKTQLFTNRVMTFMQPLMMLIMNAVSVLIVWTGASYIDSGAIQIGDMIAFITYSMVIIMGFLMMSMIAIMLPRADVAAGRIDEVMATRAIICDPSDARDNDLPTTSGAKICFDDVTFAYGDSSEPVLSHISFTTEPGTTTAFIGSTGSGKSTVLKLLMRFHDVSEGSITLDGIDVRDLSQHTLHANLGYVPQKAFLFSGTIGSNIAYADESISDDRILKAASIAQAEDFIQSKEDGLDAAVSQGGTNVSGGQRQRLAIARALAADARAYLFDDSFSALDYATDAALRKALSEQLGGKTVVIVAQRVSTIRTADNIIVLEEGSIVGQGTHDELMQSCPTYREIALSQLSAEELGGGDAA